MNDMTNNTVSDAVADEHKIRKLENPERAAKLFEGFEDTLVWSSLQGIMGGIYAVGGDNIESAVAINADFSFFAGKPDEALIRFVPKDYENDYIIMTPQNDAWSEAIKKCLGDKAVAEDRYAIKKEPDCFDKDKLRRILSSLPEKYKLAKIDKTLYDICLENEWSEDFVSHFDNYKEFNRLGLGYVALENGVPVSGASSYIRFKDGIEIEVDTESSHRRQGLATACSAALILDALDRGLYPSWDAQNLWSVALAKKLGYHYSHTYKVFYVEFN